MKISWNRIKPVVGAVVSIAAIVSSCSIGHVKGHKTGRLQSEIDWAYINLRLFSMSYRNNRKIPEEIADRYGFDRRFIDQALMACVIEIDYKIGITNILDTIEDEYDKRIFLSTYNKAREYCAQMPQARYYPDVFPCELAEPNRMDVPLHKP